MLSTNFDDEETREALSTLSDLYATPSSPPPLPTTSTKGKLPEAQQTEDRDEGHALHDVDMAPTTVTAPAQVVLVEVVPGESAARARKNLRRDMENQLAEGSRKFLDALGEVDAVCF